MTTDADHALDVLAEAETGPERELAELVRAAHPVTASGGLVVAILADRDEESLRQVASLRQPGGSGLAIVLDTATFADSPVGAHTSAGRSAVAGSTGRPVGERLRRAAAYRGLVGRRGRTGRPRPRGVVRTDHARGAGRMISRAVDALLAAAATIAASSGSPPSPRTPRGWAGPIWACLVVAAVGAAAAPADLVPAARAARSARGDELGGHRDVRGRPALVRPARPRRVAAGGRARRRLRGRDAALCGADPCHRRGGVRPRRRDRRVWRSSSTTSPSPRRCPGSRACRCSRPSSPPRPTAARRSRRGSSSSRAAMWLVLVARQGRGRVQRWSTTVASLRTPGRRDRRREPGDVGVRQRGPAAGCRRRRRRRRPAGGHPAPADPVPPRRPRPQRRQCRARRSGRLQLDRRPGAQPAER